MQGKTVLVTGATDGIGKETALALAAQGARVFIVGRDAQKTEMTAHTLRGMSANPQVIGLVADLSRMRDVHELADEVMQRCDRLDVLVNNAGAMYPDYHSTDEGFEATFALNYLSAFLLTNRLLPLMRVEHQHAFPARVINVASVAHKQNRHIGDPIDVQALERYRGAGEAGYSATRANALAKYALVMFTFALARHYQGDGLTANALHPGFVATKLTDALPPRDRFTFSVVNRLMGVTPGEGAATSIYLASSPEVGAVTGMYFMNRKPALPADGTRDTDAQDTLWALSEAWTLGKAASASA